MTTLVTGAGGFLGRPTVERLLARGKKLRCLVRSQPPTDQPDARIEFLKGNLLSPPDMERALDGVDTIYHLAAETKGSVPDMFLNTVIGSKRLLEAARRVKRIVLVSSFGVYGIAELKRGAVVDEETPLERHPELRDGYSFVKHRQEVLFRQYQQKLGFELVALRPGLIYGPGNASLSTRIGVKLPGFFLGVGAGNQLPLTFVENCAEAIAVAGDQSAVDTVNVVDDDVITCGDYFRDYRQAVNGFRSVRIPYCGALLLARAIAWYNRASSGQLPAVLTPYKAAVLWKGNHFRNERLKAIGWRQLVPTAVGLQRTFEWIRTRGASC